MIQQLADRLEDVPLWHRLCQHNVSGPLMAKQAPCVVWRHYCHTCEMGWDR